MKKPIKKYKNKFMNKLKKWLKTPGLFSRLIVIFCLAYCVRIVEWQMDVFENTQSEASELVAAGLALFGGELLLLCIKRVFSNGRKESEEDYSDVE
jgi:uncharacterized membrane protein YgdD (TMEM256/DUF423 family)